MSILLLTSFECVKELSHSLAFYTAYISEFPHQMNGGEMTALVEFRWKYTQECNAQPELHRKRIRCDTVESGGIAVAAPAVDIGEGW